MMMDDSLAAARHPARASCKSSTVTDLATRRRGEDVVSSISFVFGGVHYGTFPVLVPYTNGKPLVLYVVPQSAGAAGGFTGPLDCLVTDDEALAADLELAQ
jgi:hypothetical protein